jgi:hypothetical protein
MLALQLPPGVASGSDSTRTGQRVTRERGALLSLKGFTTMWYFDSGLAELMGVVYRLCTVIWGN